MKRTKGSALLWAVVVVMVLSIAVAGALSVSYAYYRRSITNHTSRQAYLTSKNILTDIVENIKLNNEDYIALFTNLNEGETTPLTISLPTSIGAASVDADIAMLPKEESRGKITIRVKTTYLEQSYTMKADMQLGRMEDGIEKWQLLRYYNYDDAQETIDNNKRAALLYTDMVNLLNANKSGGYQEVKTLMQSDITGWENFTNRDAAKAATVLKQAVFNDTQVCYYLYYRSDTAGYKEFYVDELGEDAKAKLNNFHKGAKLYIRAKFSHATYTFGFVYASSNDQDSGFPGNVRLFYHDGHWYYVDKVKASDYITGGSDKETSGVSPTTFDGSDGENRYKRFSDAYFTAENQIT